MKISGTAPRNQLVLPQLRFEVLGKRNETQTAKTLEKRNEPSKQTRTALRTREERETDVCAVSQETRPLARLARLQDRARNHSLAVESSRGQRETWKIPFSAVSTENIRALELIGYRSTALWISQSEIKKIHHDC